MQRDVFHFQAVRVPFGVAHSCIRDEPHVLFGPFDHTAEIETLLDIELGGLVFGADVVVDIGDFEDSEGPLPVVRRSFSWRAADHAGLFPVLEGELEAYPLTAGETQLTFTCRYRPPMYVVGAAVDAVYLHRVAEGCIDRFFDRLVDRFETTWQALTESETPSEV